MLARVLEPEVMDSPAEAAAYDAMDHAEVNRRFVADLLAAGPAEGEFLDLGAGTAQIPIELSRQLPGARIVAVDQSASMLELAERNVRASGFRANIALLLADAKHLPQATGRFATVISNSIIHHIPQPADVLAESVRVAQPGGLLFVRDLLRPSDDTAVAQLLAAYAAEASAHARRMFDDSLRAALSLDEIRALVVGLGFDPSTVTATSDRHWTWIARKPN
jgi:ubiquinone/menaquinone biosynthesis C-methylase UbiE